MTPRPIPEPWQQLMRRAGIHSIRQLCAAADLGSPTVERIIHRTGKRPRHESVLKVADALNVTPQTIYNLLDQEAPEAPEPWVPPEESVQLTRPERKAIDQLIRAVVNARNRREAGTAEPAPQWNVTPIRGMAADNRGPTDGQQTRDHIDTVGEEPQD